MSTEETPVYGLLGRTLKHSYSPMIHKILGGYDYEIFEKEPEELEDFLRNGPFKGINVTIPYKETVMPFCDRISEAAMRIGCVNTIVRQEDGTLVGDNTDYYGFAHLVQTAHVDIPGKKVVVLGAGGASKTVCTVLQNLDASEVVVISRRDPDNNYDNIAKHYDAEIIVNTTPVGMFPNCPASPIDLAPFASEGETRLGYHDGLLAVFDVVYNPARTGIMLQAEKLGIPAFNGLAMLVAQAKRASELFTGSFISEEMLAVATEKVASNMRNIVLIGMPSGGKSTIGSMLAQRLGRDFVDVDDVIPQVAGKSITEIFAQDGEATLRDIETQVTGDVCKKSGLVVACGGGVVTQPRNYDLLHQNGIVVLLRRSLDLLVADGRPMSISKGIGTLERERRRKYLAWADVAIENDSTPDVVVDRIIEALG